MNPEQIKIIIVMVATLIIAILIDSFGSSSSIKTPQVINFSSTPSNYTRESPGSSGSKKKSSSSSSSCSKNGIKLYGKVQFVDSFPDLKIEYVSSFPDIKVEFVNSFPDSCGKWQVVDSFPDFKVQVVSSFPDLKVEKVTSFPGMN